MRKFQCLLFVLKRSCICYYIICMSVPLIFRISANIPTICISVPNIFFFFFLRLLCFCVSVFLHSLGISIFSECSGLWIHLFQNIEKQPPEVFCEKKVFLEISQNSQENTFARVSFLIKLFNKLFLKKGSATEICNFI